MAEVGGGVEDLIFAGFVVTLTSGMASLLRLHAGGDTTTPTRYGVVWQFTAALEYAVFACEINYILWEGYPLGVYMGAVFLFSLYQEIYLPGAGNPVDTLRFWEEGKVSWVKALIHVLAQVGGACVAYPVVVRPLWSAQGKLGLGWRHVDKIQRDSWTSAVWEYDPKLSALAEAGVTGGMYLVALGVAEVLSGEEEERRVEILVGVALNTVLYTSGAAFSGAFYNPAVATGLEGGLTSGGGGVGAKIWIYWVGPLLGITAALKFQNWLLPKRGQEGREEERSREEVHED